MTSSRLVVGATGTTIDSAQVSRRRSRRPSRQPRGRHAAGADNVDAQTSLIAKAAVWHGFGPYRRRHFACRMATSALVAFPRRRRQSRARSDAAGLAPRRYSCARNTPVLPAAVGATHHARTKPARMIDVEISFFRRSSHAFCATTNARGTR